MSDIPGSLRARLLCITRAGDALPLRPASLCRVCVIVTVFVSECPRCLLLFVYSFVLVSTDPCAKLNIGWWLRRKLLLGIRCQERCGWLQARCYLVAENWRAGQSMGTEYSFGSIVEEFAALCAQCGLGTHHLRSKVALALRSRFHIVSLICACIRKSGP